MLRLNRDSPDRWTKLRGPVSCSLRAQVCDPNNLQEEAPNKDSDL